MHPLLVEGLTDAIGFFVGVLVAWGVSRLLGFDPLSQGYDSTSIGGIVMAGLGGGLGLHAARRFRASRQKKNED